MKEKLMKIKSIILTALITIAATSGLFAQNKDTTKSNNKTLVVYFSWSGNLEKMANYDTIFFGFTAWWYDLPMPMWTFLESYNFKGKTIIPFFSHEGSSNGANALPTVEKLAKGASVKSKDALSIRGGNVAKSEKEVRAWVKK